MLAAYMKSRQGDNSKEKKKVEKPSQGKQARKRW
jgi:hypothetical protein